MNISVRLSQVFPPLLLATSLVAIATPTQAQSLDILWIPSSSEQFFLEGLEHMEREIDELQEGSDTETEILIIAPSIEEQGQNLEQQSLEQQSMAQGDGASADTATLLSCIPD